MRYVCRVEKQNGRNRIFQDQPKEVITTNGKKPLDVAALVLSIITVVAAALIPLVSYVCGIIGLVFAIKHRKDKRTTVALILCFVGLISAVVSNVIARKTLMETMESMLG